MLVMVGNLFFFRGVGCFFCNYLYNFFLVVCFQEVQIYQGVFKVRKVVVFFDKVWYYELIGSIQYFGSFILVGCYFFIVVNGYNVFVFDCQCGCVWEVFVYGIDVFVGDDFICNFLFGGSLVF